DRIQFIIADTTIEDLFATNFRIERPLPFALHDWNRQWEIVITDHENCLVWIFLVDLDRFLLLRSIRKIQRALLVHHRILGVDQTSPVWSETILSRGRI